MGEENKEKGTSYSFMQEKVKQRPFYKNPKIQKGFAAVAGGVIFALAATLVWAVLIPHISRKAEEKGGAAQGRTAFLVAFFYGLRSQQQVLAFFPLPQGQGSFRPTVFHMACSSARRAAIRLSGL